MSKASFTKVTLSAIILDHLDKALMLRATAHKFGRENSMPTMLGAKSLMDEHGLSCFRGRRR